MIDLATEAADLNRSLHSYARDAQGTPDVAALCVAEEAGELVGAYRRWSGAARRPGTLEELEREVADVLIVTAMLADVVGIDINKALEEKLAIIRARPWKEEAA